jgi:Ca2+-binding RTX toxin-like protein
VVVNQPTTCTATVTDTEASGPSTPSGTVSFTAAPTGSGVFDLSSCTLAAGAGASAHCSVTYTPTALATGSQTITASYGSDATHAASDGSQTVGVGQRSASTDLSCSPNPVAVDAPAACTATVTDDSPGTPSTPTGSVGGFDSNGSGSFGGGPCDLAQTGPGVATCSFSYTPSAIGTGSQTLSAQYGGDSTHAGEILSSGFVFLGVSTRSTSTSVSCSPATVIFGQSTTCTATVTDTAAGTASTPSGAVRFGSSDPGSFSGSPCTLSGSGASASCSVTYTQNAVDSGSPTITAGYGGDTIHATSSGSQTVTVVGHPTSTKVSCSPDSVNVGHSSTCTATVTDTTSGMVSTPSGTVSFSSSGPGGFSGSPCTLSGSGASASCSVIYTPSAVGSGPHTISGGYGGDATHAGSNGSQSVAVTAAGSSSTQVRCAPGSVAAGAASTCTATVRDTTASGKTPPTGTVKFSADAPGKFSPRSCPLVKSSPAAARCAVTFTPSGSGGLVATITAGYGGDATHRPSSATTTLKVTAQAGCAGRSARIVGSAGSDRLIGTRRRDMIAAGAGKDRIRAGGGNDLVCAGPGNDLVRGGSGNDRLSGQTGSDTLFGGPGRDVLDGGRGNDRLFGGPGKDRVFGGPGNDRLNPGAGRDHVRAGARRDRIVSVDGQRDMIDCGPGRDVATVDAVDRVRRCETVIQVRGVRTLAGDQHPAGLG